MVNPSEDATRIRQITSQIEFENTAYGIVSNPQFLDFSEKLGFVTSQLFAVPPEADLIGFTGERQVNRETSEGTLTSGITAVTEFNELQECEKTIAMQARGVGTRIYNTPQALLGTGEGPNIGAYLLRIDSEKIVDLRNESPLGRATQLATQVVRKIRSEVQGVQKTVEGVHESFGPEDEVDAVLYGQSRRMRQQQTEQGIEQIEGITPAFMIIRNPYITMHKIGTLKAAE